MLEDAFRGELRDLAGLFASLCEDLPCEGLQEALREYIVALPVYRTYAVPEREELSRTDRDVIEEALSLAGKRCGCDPRTFDPLRDVLLLQRRGELETDFVLRLQQLSGPVMAKGAEDTAFYRYYRLLSLNEVGGDPGRWGTSLQAFHDYCTLMADGWPGSMLATATHDTKRGEDARTRLDGLSEMPNLWREAAERWAAMNGALREETGLDPATEYEIYQALIGAWPVEQERLRQFATKAVREAKLRTTWDAPDSAYEDGLQRFIAGLYDNAGFVTDVAAFVATISRAGWMTSLSQTLIKLTAPGVPDVYQGCELWDHSLVDPDNRRRVDYSLRRRLLNETKSLSASSVLRGIESGIAKLWLLRKTLELRRKEAAAFDSSYEALYAKGARADHVVAFVRGERVLSVAPRWWHTLDGDWRATTLRLPPGLWRNHLTEALFDGGKDVAVEALIGGFPVALLVKTEA
jgi:(1->4)-alpha-D-glucan 1-alpha-D-glucosylmutase